MICSLLVTTLRGLLPKGLKTFNLCNIMLEKTSKGNFPHCRAIENPYEEDRVLAEVALGPEVEEDPYRHIIGKVQHVEEGVLSEEVPRDDFHLEVERIPVKIDAEVEFLQDYILRARQALEGYAHDGFGSKKKQYISLIGDYRRRFPNTEISKNCSSEVAVRRAFHSASRKLDNSQEVRVHQ